jgi:hypothetical protein
MQRAAPRRRCVCRAASGLPARPRVPRRIDQRATHAGPGGTDCRRNAHRPKLSRHYPDRVPRSTTDQRRVATGRCFRDYSPGRGDAPSVASYRFTSICLGLSTFGGLSRFCHFLRASASCHTSITLTRSGINGTGGDGHVDASVEVTSTCDEATERGYEGVRPLASTNSWPAMMITAVLRFDTQLIGHVFTVAHVIRPSRSRAPRRSGRRGCG